MKKTILLIISILSACQIYAQETAEQLLEQANSLYSKGTYDSASVIYENLIEEDYISPGLYYNLGNAYYKQNVISRAILNYEKALLLNPNDEDINYNLQLTNRLVVDKIEVLPVFFLTLWIRNLKKLFTSDIWAWISIITFIATLLFVSLYLYSRGIGLKKISFILGLFLILMSLVSFAFSYQQKQKIAHGETAIVMNPSVTVKSSPDNSGTNLFVIHEGTKVWLGDKISGWYEIKLSDGSKGWLKTEDVEII